MLDKSEKKPDPEDWGDEPTAVTLLHEQRRASLIEARKALEEQADASDRLREAARCRSPRQLRRSLTPPPFPAVKAVASGS